MIDKIKILREVTLAGVMQCKKALDEANGDVDAAKDILIEHGLKDNKRKERDTNQGIISCYSHPNLRIGVLVELNCETDFVARNEEFQKLAHEICLQIAAMAPDSVDDMLRQEYVRDGSQTMQNLIDNVIRKTGENIKVHRFIRYGLGEE